MAICRGWGRVHAISEFNLRHTLYTISPNKLTALLCSRAIHYDGRWNCRMPIANRRSLARLLLLGWILYSGRSASPSPSHFGLGLRRYMAWKQSYRLPLLLTRQPCKHSNQRPSTETISRRILTDTVRTLRSHFAMRGDKGNEGLSGERKWGIGRRASLTFFTNAFLEDVDSIGVIRS